MPRSSGSPPLHCSYHNRRVACTLAVFVVVLITVAAVSADPMSALRVTARASWIISGGRYLGADSMVFQSTLYDCGPAALASLMITLGAVPPPLDSIRKLAGTSIRGTTIASLTRASTSLGLHLRPYMLPSSHVQHSALPLIAWIDRGHFVVVKAGNTAGTVTVLDPQAGRYRLSIAQLATRWTGEAIVRAAPSTGGATPGSATLRPPE
ncbi:MAG: cysteine peptidase family C39 domain-containing protein [Gemmatimonadaceae bacterium]